MTMMTMMTVIDNVVDHYTYQTRWGQKRTHAKIHPDNDGFFEMVFWVFGIFVGFICLPWFLFFVISKQDVIQGHNLPDAVRVM